MRNILISLTVILIPDLNYFENPPPNPAQTHPISPLLHGICRKTMSQSMGAHSSSSSSSSNKLYLPTPRPALSEAALNQLCRVLLLPSITTTSTPVEIDPLSQKKPSSDSAFNRVNSICKKLSCVDANKNVILKALGKVAGELGEGSTKELLVVRKELERAANDGGVGVGGKKRDNDGGIVNNFFSSQVRPTTSSLPPSAITISSDSDEMRLLRVLQTLQVLGKAEEKRNGSNSSNSSSNSSNISSNSSNSNSNSNSTDLNSTTNNPESSSSGTLPPPPPGQANADPKKSSSAIWLGGAVRL